MGAFGGILAEWLAVSKWESNVVRDSWVRGLSNPPSTSNLYRGPLCLCIPYGYCELQCCSESRQVATMCELAAIL